MGEKRLKMALNAGLWLSLVSIWTGHPAVLSGEMAADLPRPLVSSEPTAQRLPAHRSNPEAERLFGPTNLWTFHLRIEAISWAEMEPTDLQLFRPPQKDSWEFRRTPGPQTNNPSAASGADTNRVFDYARATLECEGQILSDIGIRFKGNSSFMAARESMKRSFKLDFNRFVRRQKFFGLKKLNLNNNVLDSSMARQALASEVFRAAGIPAPRTAFVRVYLTVPGQFDRQFLGLYTAVEQVDDQFIGEWLGDKTGLLMKPEFTRGLTYLGEEWKPYEPMFAPEAPPTPNAARRVIDFVRLIDCAPEEVFRQQIGGFIEARQFLRFLAVQALIANLDSPLAHGQNYYLYLPAWTGRFVFIPNDFDLSFGHYPTAGSMAQQAELDIWHPYEGKHSWLDRYLAVPGMREAFRREYEALLAGPFARERVMAMVDAMGKVIRQAAADDPHIAMDQLARSLGSSAATSTATQAVELAAPHPGQARDQTVSSRDSPDLSLRDLIARRFASARAQLAGTGRGYIPVTVEREPPASDRPAVVLAWQITRMGDANRDGQISLAEFSSLLTRWFAEWDADRSGTLNQTEVKAGFKRMVPAAPNVYGANEKRSGMIFPEENLAGQLLWPAGVPASHEFPAGEFIASGTGWFKTWDADHNGRLIRSELEGAIEPMLK